MNREPLGKKQKKQMTPEEWREYHRRAPVVAAQLVVSFAESALNNCAEDHPARPTFVLALDAAIAERDRLQAAYDVESIAIGRETRGVDAG